MSVERNVFSLAAVACVSFKEACYTVCSNYISIVSILDVVSVNTPTDDSSDRLGRFEHSLPQRVSFQKELASRTSSMLAGL
jgi:hypothetical protein